MSEGITILLPDEAATLALGAALAARLSPGDVLHLEGELGAGKTTLVRGLIQSLLPGSRVRSPTYTLVEPYSTPAFEILHLDLYRLGSPDELDALGVRERVGEAVILAEWPSRGAGALPGPDLRITLAHAGERRTAHLEAQTARGEVQITALSEGLPKSSVGPKECVPGAGF